MIDYSDPFPQWVQELQVRVANHSKLTSSSHGFLHFSDHVMYYKLLSRTSTVTKVKRSRYICPTG